MTPSKFTTYLCTLLTALLLLLISGQSVVACERSERPSGSLRVNSCHGDVTGLTPAAFCCEGITCHRSTPPVRQLAGPEFSNHLKDRHPLILEYRQNIPQPKSGHPFDQPHIQSPSFFVTATVSLQPRQAQHILQTTILLH